MIYILDNNLNMLGLLSNKGNAKNKANYFDDTYTRELATGAETLTFSTYSNTPQASLLRVSNYVLIIEDNENKLFQITETTERHNNEQITEVYCEMAGIELLNESIAPFYSSSMNVKQLLTNILSQTDFKVGYVDKNLSNTLEIDIQDYSKVYNILQNYIIGEFGAEIKYRIETKGGRVVNKYIDLYKHRGTFNGFRFDYSKNMTSVERKIDSSNLITACIGIGKDGLTFEDVEADDKPRGQNFIADEDAYYLWNKKGNHIIDVVNFETDNPEELLTLTRKELNNRKTPQFTYTLSVELLDEKVNLGDTVYVVDNSFYPPLHLSARVSKLSTSRTDKNNNICELSNFKAIKSKISNNSFDGSIEDLINSRFPIKTGDISNGAITSDKVSEGAINTVHIQENSITSDLIMANQIKSEHILANNIKTEHLEANSITSDKIGANEINANHINSGSITSEKIDVGAINSEHINSGQINADHIQADQIDTNHIKADAITSDKISANSITSDKINVGAITSDKILADTIDTNHLKANIITSEKIQANSITTEKLSANSITSDKISANSITSDKINANSITSEHIQASSITTEHLQADIVSAENIQAGSITADKIGVGVIQSKHLTTEELITNKAQIKTGLIENAHIKDATITSAKIGEGQIGSAHITEASILNTHIANANIENAHIKDATITDAKILNLNANKINAGTIDTGKITISDTDGILRITGNKLQVFDNSDVPKERVRVGEYEGKYGLVVRGEDGSTVLYDENGVYNEGITDGAITNEKITDNSIDSRTLNIDELFVGDNAFINSLHALEIDAGQITTGKIKNELIDLEGVVSFTSLNKDFADIFIKPEGSDKTYINGGTIYTDSITADKITLKGLTIQKEGYTTLSISDEGDVTVSGEIISNNFSNVTGHEAGYRITPDGVAIFNDAILRGSVILPTAGITNESNIRFFAGADFANKENAPFKVFNDGSIEALKGYFGGTFTGEINIGNIHISDTDKTDAYFVINNNDETETLISLRENEAKFNVDFNIDDKFKYNKSNDKFDIYSSFNLMSEKESNLYKPKEAINLRLTPSWSGDVHRMVRPNEVLTVVGMESDWYKVNDNGTICYAPPGYLIKQEFNKGYIELNLLDNMKYHLLYSRNLSGGIHSISNKVGNGGLDFISSGTSQTEGESEYDFRFTRENEEEQVQVDILGNLSVTNKIKMSEDNKVEIISVGGSNSGIDFMLR